MLISQIDIKNFRGIKDVSIPLGDFCVLIGENNTGKSTVIDALRKVLIQDATQGSNIFEPYDYHMDRSNSNPASSEPIEITLTFKERKIGAWSENFPEILNGILQYDTQGLGYAILRVESKFDQNSNSFDTKYFFVDENENQIFSQAESEKLSQAFATLRMMSPTFFLESLRDAAGEFQSNSRFWSPFVHAGEIDDTTRDRIEANVSNLNREILQNHTNFELVMDELEEMSVILPIGSAEPITIDAIPSKIFDLLSRTQVNLESLSGAQIPVTKHGGGTQSLAVIMLFNAFIKSQKTAENQFALEPTLLMEEPEANLHPPAVKSVVDLLKNILTEEKQVGEKVSNAQIILTTHSPDFISHTDLRNVRRLAKKDGGIVVFPQHPLEMSEDMERQLNYHIRRSNGNLLYYRCWILVEGETETTVLTESARALKMDLHNKGVVCVEISKSRTEYFIKYADQMGIEWILLADNDEGGKRKYVNPAEKLLGNRNHNKHIRQLDGNLEILLCKSGFGDIYEGKLAVDEKNKLKEEYSDNMSEYWNQVTNNKRVKDFKTSNALEAANRIISVGESIVPQPIREVIQQAVTSANGDLS